jgi:uncharacterized protein
MQRIEGTLVLSPTDLVAFTGCEHRTFLDRLVAVGELERETRDDPLNDVLRKRGNEHERSYLDALREQAGTVVEIPRFENSLSGLRAGEAATLAAMGAGAEVIYQATFFDGRWRGHADFLRRVDTPSELGAWSYEVLDTKLARRTKASALLQLGEYTRHVARLQGVPPRLLHVVLGNGVVEPFLYAELDAYLEVVRTRFMAAVDGPLQHTSPEPVALCGVCDWRDRCSGEWRRADHLSFVAGMRRDQRAGLIASGISTLTALAQLSPATTLDGVGDASLAALREQAGLQLRSDRERGLAWQLIEPDPAAPHRGLAALPEPSPSDIFFDMEGDQFVGPEGREYLFGWVADAGGSAPFQALWAHSAAAEKAAFERFIDTVMAARRRDPAMHVYHYASYELSAVKKLMGRYATRENEVDELLRAGVFVDLYRVVRQGVRIGVESYSIKKLEPLYTGARSAAIADATTSIVEYERWLDDADSTILASIRAYNEEDCRSLVGLRGWLEDRRRDLERRQGAPLPRPAHQEGAPSEAVLAATTAAEQLAEQLTAGIPVDAAEQSEEQRALILLAALLDWHRRESKPAWWEYFERRKASEEDLVDDASSLGGLTFDADIGSEKRSRLYRFRFPVQETKLRAGDSVEDPRTFTDDAGIERTRRVGEIHWIDTVAGEVVVKSTKLPEPAPTALCPAGPPSTTAHAAALHRVGSWVLVHGIGSRGEFRAVRELLLRARPSIAGVDDGAPLRVAHEDVVEATRRSIADADQACIPVQGPPGSGKTRTAAMAIIDLVTASPPRRLAVTALSHRAITHLLDRVCQEAEERGATIRVLQKTDAGRGCTAAQVQCTADNGAVVAALEEGVVDIVAGTSWLFARDEMSGRFDTLFVDEAGQLSLADVVAVGGCADSIVLLGDPQQLQQPSQGSHPPGAQVSALGHLLGDSETIADDRGLFLDVTWRMHPDVCRYISDTFYDSRLTSAADCERQRVLGGDELAGTGLRWLAVAHHGNRSASEQEADATSRLVERLLGRRWIDRDGVERTLTVRDVLVVAPYNAHVAALQRHLPSGVECGTVDRIQGQQAAVVIYSMATSLAEDAPRGMDFLFARNRMNVAISRAMCLAILVCSPDLPQMACTRAADIPLANALCAFVVEATSLAGSVPRELVAVDGGAAHAQLSIELDSAAPVRY